MNQFKLYSVLLLNKLNYKLLVNPKLNKLDIYIFMDWFYSPLNTHLNKQLLNELIHDMFFLLISLFHPSNIYSLTKFKLVFDSHANFVLLLIIVNNMQFVSLGIPHWLINLSLCEDSSFFGRCIIHSTWFLLGVEEY